MNSYMIRLALNQLMYDAILDLDVNRVSEIINTDFNWKDFNQGSYLGIRLLVESISTHYDEVDLCDRVRDLANLMISLNLLNEHENHDPGNVITYLVQLKDKVRRHNDPENTKPRVLACLNIIIECFLQLLTYTSRISTDARFNDYDPNENVSPGEIVIDPTSDLTYPHPSH